MLVKIQEPATLDVCGRDVLLSHQKNSESIVFHFSC